ncbi:MAG: 30S ribosomal protein S3 [Eubacteriales bacterium]|nr:30S ribosomal protein S3 [Eubacteriales bacterium]MDD4323286.1 30S ribosomal protein S3 [Eubacteriales bacterium]MDD4540981.1 30S ribosomal protein S3 [Eubacteriales bacterium]
MGQKVNPHGFRVGVIKDWDSRWYADKKNFSRYLVEDKKIRDQVLAETSRAGVSRIEIEREGDDKTVVTITTGKPGIIIGRQGAEIEKLKKKLTKQFGSDFYINVKEVRNVDIEAQLVAEGIARQLEARTSFRRAMKQAIGRAMKNGAKGIKTMVAGRLGGAEIARSEQYHEGTIPLHTLRADIDYGFAEAHTAYGLIGVKVWIYKGEVLPVKKTPAQEGGTPDVNA